MKKICLIVAVAVSMAFSFWDCKVIDNGFFSCTQEFVNDSGAGTSQAYYFMKLQKDDSWLLKAITDDYELVIISKSPKLKIDNDILRSIKDGYHVDESVLDSLAKDINEHARVIGAMKCPSPDMVVTFKEHKVTGLRTDRREYKNLKPGTYCEDFVATDALYWKP